MTETVIYFTPIVRHFNFSCRIVQIQKKNSHFCSQILVSKSMFIKLQVWADRTFSKKCNLFYWGVIRLVFEYLPTSLKIFETM